jgi:hypothetical protein
MILLPVRRWYALHLHIAATHLLIVEIQLKSVQALFEDGQTLELQLSLYFLTREVNGELRQRLALTGRSSQNKDNPVAPRVKTLLIHEKTEV